MGCFKFSKIFHPRQGFQSTLTLHNNHLVAFFLLLHFIQLLHFTSGHDWPYTKQHEWVSLAPDYQPAWWVWALPPTHTRQRKNEWGLLQMVMPFRSLSFPLMERVGSYSPDWVLGSVQAAAANEVFPPLSCWSFWLGVYLASVLSACFSMGSYRGNREACWPDVTSSFSLMHACSDNGWHANLIASIQCTN